jgi:hypothetical protein
MLLVTKQCKMYKIIGVSGTLSPNFNTFKEPSYVACTGSFSCFCLSLGSRTPWGLFTLGSSLGVFSSCIVLKHFSQMARFPLFTDFFSNCDFSRILCIDY